MGWSVETRIQLLKKIFKKENRRFKVTHPESPYPTVLIQYEGKQLGLDALTQIEALWPEFVYINFNVGILFPDNPTDITITPAQSTDNVRSLST